MNSDQLRQELNTIIEASHEQARQSHGDAYVAEKWDSVKAARRALALCKKPDVGDQSNLPALFISFAQHLAKLCPHHLQFFGRNEDGIFAPIQLVPPGGVIWHAAHGLISPELGIQFVISRSHPHFSTWCSPIVWRSTASILEHGAEAAAAATAKQFGQLAMGVPQ